MELAICRCSFRAGPGGIERECLMSISGLGDKCENSASELALINPCLRAFNRACAGAVYVRSIDFKEGTFRPLVNCLFSGGTGKLAAAFESRLE